MSILSNCISFLIFIIDKGITKGDLVNGLEFKNNKIVANTLITHKSQNTKKFVIGEIDIKR